MSFLNKLAFWKKSDGFDSGLPPDLGSSSYAPDTSTGFDANAPLPDLESSYEPGPVSTKASMTPPLGFERPQAFSQAAYPQAAGLPIDKEIEMISLKLDAIKSELDAINQRLVRVEKLTELSVNRTGKNPRDIWAAY